MGSRKLDIDQPIFITGAARSGTSMTAGVINLCGAWGGVMSGPTIHNKKGMFENNALRAMNKDFLTKMRCDPLGQRPLPKINVVMSYAMSNFQDWRREVLNNLKKQGQKEDRSWFYKGAKMCLLWPMWYLSFQKAHWIIVRRKKEDIIRSCMKTGFMRKCDGPKGWDSWVDEHLRRFKEMKNAGLNIHEVWPQHMVSGDFSEIRSVVENLGLKWNREKVTEFITPALWSAGVIPEEVTDDC
jgi:hypothetical protein